MAVMPTIPNLPASVAPLVADEDWYDEWGACLGALWSIVNALEARGEDAHDDADYSFGPLHHADETAMRASWGADDDGDYGIAVEYLDELDAGTFTLDDLHAAARALDNYADALRAAGKDY